MCLKRSDELLTGIGHTQMLINGNLTTLRKLCKVYLEANSHVKKQSSIDYIPLRSDLEGFWDLILLQYRRYELQFPILVNWISKDFRNELHLLIEKCLDNSTNYSNEYHGSIKMNNENRKISRKPTNTVTQSKSKKLSDVNNKSIRSIQQKTKIRQEIDNARKQHLLEKRKEKIP
ncbi:Lmp3-like protein [Schistosoma japonicum]|uniref:Lmp3-like protein n=1 Tax=Schistosoma japonicum TaxID=6182 RepID=A0A4Z2D6L2_SCHJA|nr:Lmp3-like protein [Schistosoma japonicum]